MTRPLLPFTVRVPSRIRAVAVCRTWDFEHLPGPDECEVVLDLHSWMTVTASAVVGIITTMAHLCQRGYVVRVTVPDSDYARRMLATVGFVEALETFADITGSKPTGTIRRVLPVVKVMNFKTETDVERMTNEMAEMFGAHHSLLPGALLQDATTALAEAANNAVQHSACPVGGFALVQVRRLSVGGSRRHFLEIAVGDPGQGIAASLGLPDDGEAVAEAMQEGRTSTGDRHRGLGLYYIKDLIVGGSSRMLVIHSGRGQYYAQNTVLGLRESSGVIRSRYPGTIVTVALPV